MIRIGDKDIGDGKPCYIIAEAGVNHNGSLDLALQLVKKAKEVGADCVKFQTFKADRVVTSTSPKAAYQLKVTSQTESQLEMLKKLELSYDDYTAIIAYARKCGIQILSTPYSEEDADFLMDLGLDAFKIASGQLVESSFLKYVASKRIPLIISTGMSTMKEIANAVEVIRETGNEQIVILQCTTNYPSKMEDANIMAMKTMEEAFKVITGYSDHVPENYACYAAVSLGANVIEKHFTLDKNMEGPDHSSSLDSAEFADLVYGVRQVEKSLGNGIKVPTDDEKKNTEGMRRSIVAKMPLKKGDVLSYQNLCYKRPATGLKPDDIDSIIGKKLNCDLVQDEQIELKHIEW